LCPEVNGWKSSSAMPIFPQTDNPVMTHHLVLHGPLLMADPRQNNNNKIKGNKSNDIPLTI
jgi:hypothetical protein